MDNLEPNVKRFLEYVGDMHKEEILSMPIELREDAINIFMQEEASKIIKFNKKEQIEKYGFYISPIELQRLVPIDTFIDEETGEIAEEIGMDMILNQFMNSHHDRINDGEAIEDDDIDGYVKFSEINIGDIFIHKQDGSKWIVKQKTRSSDGKKAILFDSGWGGPMIFEYSGLANLFDYQKKKQKKIKIPKLNELKIGQIIEYNSRPIAYIVEIINRNSKGIYIKIGAKKEYYRYPDEFPTNWEITNKIKEVGIEINEGEYSYETYYDALKEIIVETEDSIKEQFFKEKLNKLKDSKRILLSRSLINFTKDLTNDIRYRSLPFDRFFIDTTIQLDDQIFMQGVMVENLDEESRKEVIDQTNVEDKLLKEDMVSKNMRIICLMYDVKHNSHFIVDDMLSRLLGNSKSLNKLYNFYLDDDEDFLLKEYDKEIKKIYMIIFNIMDLYHNRQVDKITYVMNPKHKKNRNQTGKIPLPYTTIKLGPIEELKIYLNRYNAEKTKLGYKFKVRPYWMHFYNKKRYHTLYEALENDCLEEIYQIDDDGIIKRLIAEHIRGEGPLIEKDIKFTLNKQSDTRGD